MGKDTGKLLVGNAYDAGNEIVICGDPTEEHDDWPEDDPRRHNCDRMGCGQSHVLYRFPKPQLSNTEVSGGEKTT
jgi:hypothetical protein